MIVRDSQKFQLDMATLLQVAFEYQNYHKFYSWRCINIGYWLWRIETGIQARSDRQQPDEHRRDRRVENKECTPCPADASHAARRTAEGETGEEKAAHGLGRHIVSSPFVFTSIQHRCWRNDCSDTTIRAGGRRFYEILLFNKGVIWKYVVMIVVISLTFQITNCSFINPKLRRGVPKGPLEQPR